MIHLNEEQEEAAKEALGDAPLVCITGAAGTGKTTVIKYIMDHIIGKLSWVVCAPTGRAAKRITEATGIPAMTIHRMMRYTRPENDDDVSESAYSGGNKFPYQFVLIDEASMLSNELMDAIAVAAPVRCRIRLFGDDNQLPPVNSQSPFVRLMERFPTVRLLDNHRSNNGIIQASQHILRGEFPPAGENFRMQKCRDANDIINTLLPLVDESYSTDKAQVIVPIKGGKAGTQPINVALQRTLNGDPTQKVIRIDPAPNSGNHSVFLRKGDKIIWDKNDYNMRLFNGELGFISALDNEEGPIECIIDGKSYIVPPIAPKYNPFKRVEEYYNPQQQIKLAYAITTHKAQGSEFDNVIVIVPRGSTKIMSRNNLYTAVTRARNNCVVLYEESTLRACLRKDANT